MASEAHLTSCDFTGAQMLVAQSTTSGHASHYLPCRTPGASYFLSSSIGNDCASGMRQAVHVSPSTRAIDESTGEVLLHSDSLARVMRLLGHRTDPRSGFTFLDRGYDSEASANVSLEMIWCLEAHSPSSCRDWDSAATRLSCLAEVHNLAGFVSRKRPSPQYAHAERYYLEALTYDPNHCPSLGYLAELYVSLGNATASEDAALRLCSTCGANSTAGYQAAAYYQANGIAWPCDLPRTPPPPPPPPPPRPPLAPGRAVAYRATMQLTIGVSLQEFDAAARSALRERLAAAAEVSVAAVSLSVTAGSVTVVVAITAASAAATTGIVTKLTPITASPSAASAILNVQVLAIAPAMATTHVEDDASTAVVPDDASSSLVTDSGGSPVLVVVIVAVTAVLIVVSCAVFVKRRARMNAIVTDVAIEEHKPSAKGQEPSDLYVPQVETTSATLRCLAE